MSDAAAAQFFPPTLDEQIACADREVGLRLRVYPTWVRQGRLKQHKADREIETMRAIAASLRQMQAQTMRQERD